MTASVHLKPCKFFPIVKVEIHGRPIARFDTIRHKDGSLWRYECLSDGNMLVAASDLKLPGPIRKFPKSDFGITVEMLARSA